MAKWRAYNYERVTPTTGNLLLHWADPDRENRVLFCQREAAETAIFLTEVAGRHGYPDFRALVDMANEGHHSKLPRVALKMATDAGKTVLMAILIAWQTLDKASTPLALEPAAKQSAEERSANEEAGVGFRGLQAVARDAGIKAICDLPAPRSTWPGRLPGGLHLPLGGQRIFPDGRHRIGDRGSPAH